MKMNNNNNNRKKDWYQKIASYYDRVSVNYDVDEKSYPIQQIIDVLNEKKIKDSFKCFLHGSFILDNGAGTGKWTIPLLKEGFSVVACDISLKMLKVAKAKVHSKYSKAMFVNCDITNLPFKKGKFNAIVMAGRVLSITHEPEKALEECYRVLKNGGKLWTSVCNLWSSVLLLFLEKGFSEKILRIVKEKRIYIDESLSMRQFMYKEVKRMVATAGFNIEKITGDIAFSHFLPDELLKNLKKREPLKFIERFENFLTKYIIFSPFWGEYIIESRKIEKGRQRKK